MTYYFARHLEGDFDRVVARVRDALAKEGFGVITEVDVAATMKGKLGIDFRPYLILGACNPGLAYEALMADDKVGVMLPCNVIIQRFDDGAIEVAAINPVATMSASESDGLRAVAQRVSNRLSAAVLGLA